MLFDTISYVSGADHLYDIAGSTLSAPSDSDTIMRFAAPRAFTIPANLAGTSVEVGTNPSGGAAVLQLKKNGSNITNATISISTGGGVTLGSNSAESVAAGDLIELDVTTANSVDEVAWTIKTTAA